MSLDFKEWLYEIRHSAVINPEVKKWVDSADKLKQTIDKLKLILKDKEQEKKPIKVEPEKDKEPEKKPDFKKPEQEKKPIPKPKQEKKPIKVEPEKKEPEKKPESSSKLKNIHKLTKVDKAEDKKGLNRNDKP